MPGTIHERPQALALRGIGKSYGKVRVIDDVSFELAKGEIAALLGPSGCGKTTTLRSIAGFVDPDAGTVRIEGQDVTRRLSHERDFGILFQDYALFPHLTVADNVGYGLKHRRYVGKPHRERVSEMLALVRMQDFAERYPSQLSGGQKQRVALARALAPNPAILLLDEPLSALDASVRGELQLELKQLLRDVGITSVIVTHDHEEAAVLADEVLLMNKGSIVQRGSPLDLYDYPQSLFAAEFLGEVSWLDGDVVEGAADVATVRLSCGQTVEVALRGKPFGGQRAKIGIRPERLVLSTNDAAQNRLAGTVRSVTPNRVNIQLEVELSSGTTVRALHRRNGSGPVPGEAVHLAFDRDDAFVLADTGELGRRV